MITAEELANEIYNAGCRAFPDNEVEPYGSDEGDVECFVGVARELLATFRIERIDPMKQCYFNEFASKHDSPKTCVIDDGNVCCCTIAERLIADGKGRDDCQYWGKR